MVSLHRDLSKTLMSGSFARLKASQKDISPNTTQQSNIYLGKITAPNSPKVAILDQTHLNFKLSENKPMIMSNDVNFMPKLNQTVKVTAKKIEFPVNKSPNQENRQSNLMAWQQDYNHGQQTG